MSEIPGIRVTKKLQQSVEGAASLEEIRAAMHEAAGLQGVPLATSWDENVQPVNTANFSRDQQSDSRREGPPTQAPFVSPNAEHGTEEMKTFTRVEEILVPGMRGVTRKVAFTGSSELDVQRQITDVYRFLQPTPEQLEIKSWTDATQEFLRSEIGASWPGGENNQELIGIMIASLGLVDEPDKFAALSEAYEQMKANGLVLLPNASPTEVQQRGIEELQKRSAERTANEIVDDLDAEASESLQRQTNASPQEILQAWKESLQTQGQDANDAFVRTHSKTHSGMAERGMSSGLFNR